MNDKQLRALVAVIEAGSFSRAAQGMYVAPQTIIKQVESLESEVGVRLLNRTNQGATPTDAGRAFYVRARQILALGEEAVTECGKNWGGKVLKVGISAPPGVIGLYCLEYAKAYPDVHLELVDYMECGGRIRSLLDGRCDVLEYADSSELDVYDLDFSCMLPGLPCELVVAPTHPFAGRASVGVGELEGQRIVSDNLTWIQELRRLLRDKDVNVSLSSKACTSFTVFQTCLSGGIYVMPQGFCGCFKPLVPVGIDLPLRWDFGLAFRRDRPAEVNDFLRVAVQTTTPQRIAEYFG